MNSGKDRTKQTKFLVLGILSYLPASTQNNIVAFKPYEQPVPGSLLKFKMVPIPQGEFSLGSPATEAHRHSDEGPQHTIGVSAFWIGVYEVTRDEFDVFLKDETTSQNSDVDAVTRPSPQYIDFSLGMGKEGGFPANSMSQYCALMYCKWLYQKTGIFYRLPSEAEWEYACRAGSNTAYYYGNDAGKMKDYAWFKENSDDKFHKVGQKLPNAWGIYDMLGNVMEWTLDHYEGDYYQHINNQEKDPLEKPNESVYPKSLKGGGYDTEADALRSAARFKSDPSWNRRDPQIPKSKWWLTDAAAVGFRIVRPLQQPTPEQAATFFKTYLSQ
ncbi:Formylglycine-generating enzyme, required for sulfatase activity, contains SUMF1/FGE domain [Hydrobacter penzbergensis]|uniref:Formylglycine-generating enzyme, required for sulfatase activity, contains SUMF1/FGE domain n=1 Tax=Hydrobacter penzbergensis TaxID=1235997 RepID=A0A8X8IH49_9BACT|nr:formylglycine-generating enzyme family protein [Hydrobacter penzbergensis]SDW91821.1 Formylglycine-generating enzyme, required for sulfatase activity, contains SUMF1/FGE domain [Hydrobacter penzbergensis]